VGSIRLITKDKAITNAKYLIQKTGKLCFIYRIGGTWTFTEYDNVKVQLMYNKLVREYQEVKLDG
jgi:hypothetical protein